MTDTLTPLEALERIEAVLEQSWEGKDSKNDIETIRSAISAEPVASKLTQGDADYVSALTGAPLQKVEDQSTCIAELEKEVGRLNKYVSTLENDSRAERARAERFLCSNDALTTEIADLRARLEKAVEVMKPVAAVAPIWPADVPGHLQIGNVNVTVDHCRAIAQFVKEQENAS